MRTNEVTGRTPETRSRDARARDFGEALRRAGGAATEDARREEMGGASSAPSADAAPPGRRAPGPARKGDAEGEGALLDAAGGYLHPGAGSAPATPDAPAGRPGEPSPAAELAPIVRALPVAIAAARVPDGAPLTLTFGRSLDVELRAGATGVEIVLRPEARLVAAAEAELPRMLAALRGRGIAVTRAAVRSRRAAPPPRAPHPRGAPAEPEAGGAEAR